MNRLLLLSCVLVLGLSPASAIEFELTSTMPDIVTNVNLSHYDITQSGKGPAMFTARITGDGESHTGLDIHFTIEVEAGVLGGGRHLVVEGYSNTFDLAPHETATVFSNQFMQADPSIPVKFHRKRLTHLMRNDALKRKVLDGGKIPTGHLYYTMRLRKNGTVLLTRGIDREIINVSRLELMAPGANAVEPGVTKLYSPRPVFTWISDLTDPSLYGGADIFELKLYKMESGYSVAEAMSTRPVFETRTNRTSFEYPLNARPLESGETYVWQIKAFLKGIIDASMTSKPFTFQYVDAGASGDPAVERIYDDLILLLSADYPTVAEQLMRMKAKYNNRATIHDGSRAEKPPFINDLKRRLMSGELEITRTPEIR
jgi:hypothetical protein